MNYIQSTFTIGMRKDEVTKVIYDKDKSIATLKYATLVNIQENLFPMKKLPYDEFDEVSLNHSFISSLSNDNQDNSDEQTRELFLNM